VYGVVFPPLYHKLDHQAFRFIGALHSPCLAVTNIAQIPLLSLLVLLHGPLLLRMKQSVREVQWGLTRVWDRNFYKKTSMFGFSSDQIRFGTGSSSEASMVLQGISFSGQYLGVFF